MINKLRSRFIRIATLSVAAVMLLLTLILNVANYISVDGDLRGTLTLICENRGTIPLPQKPGTPDSQTPPTPPDGADSADNAGDASGDITPPEEPPYGRGGRFTAETPYSTRYFVLFYDEDGTLTSADLKNIASVTESDTAQYLAAAVQHGQGFGRCGSYRFLVSSADGGGYMAIFLDSYQSLRTMRTVLIWSLAADAGCTLLVLVLVVLLSRRAIDPVVRSAEQQKQFITDASHELKTPITVIATSLKVLEMEVGQQKWIDKARAQTEKLKELVNSLVTLSRMDEENSPLQMADFPISDAVAETAESFRQVAESRGCPLELSVTPGLTYHGDQYAVRQLVSILLDNAIKYGTPAIPITLTLEKARKGVTIKVANGCENGGEIDTSRLFDRFYRADPARTAGGFGIGLSIARGIAEGHHGAISAKVENDVITFTAELK